MRATQCISVGLLILALSGPLTAQSLPSRLTDAEFWELITRFSEPDGHFRSDNLVSNEAFLQYVLPELVASTMPGGAYLGVGPEQNFTFISALRPGMSFIVDIRRGNLDLQLMYKALFEISTDRADFVSRLFCRPRPPGLDTESTADAIFAALKNSARADAIYDRTLEEILNHLSGTRGLPLLAQHRDGIEYVYRTFCRFGPQIHFNSTSNRGFDWQFRIAYLELMTATDADGNAWSFLEREENFEFVRDLQMKNLIVPVVGDFAGGQAIRAIGKYLTDAGALVSAFYLSNVEDYLYKDRTWTAFCSNASTLPIDAASTFIRSGMSGRFGPTELKFDLGSMALNLEACAPEK